MNEDRQTQTDRQTETDRQTDRWTESFTDGWQGTPHDEPPEHLTKAEPMNEDRQTDR